MGQNDPIQVASHDGIRLFCEGSISKNIILSLLAILLFICIAGTWSGYCFFPLYIIALTFSHVISYVMIMAVLSFMYPKSKIEKMLAISVLIFILIFIAQILGVLSSTQSFLLSTVRNQFTPGCSWSPWVLAGISFQQIIVILFRRRKYSSWWWAHLAIALIVYLTICYAYIMSRFHRFPSGIDLYDSLFAYCLFACVFVILSLPLMFIYDIPIITSFLKGVKRPLFVYSVKSSSEGDQ